MAQANGYEIFYNEVLRLREKQSQIRDALEILFDLLEEFAPMWYTEEHIGKLCLRSNLPLTGRFSQTMHTDLRKTTFFGYSDVYSDQKEGGGYNSSHHTTIARALDSHASFTVTHAA